MDMGNVKHFKLSNGEEMLCDIVEELDDEIIIRNALKIVRIEESIDKAYYIFKTWMIFQEDQNSVLSLNMFHVMGIATPAEELMQQYEVALGTLFGPEEDDDEGNSLSDNTIERVKSLLKELRGDHLNDSNSLGNIIPFFGVDKSKLH
jgi:hypothetical protein